MPGFNPDNINIHDLIIEEPEKSEDVFDPEQEITEEDWKIFKRNLNKYKNHGDWASSFSLISDAIVVDPNFETDFNESNWNNVNKWIAGLGADSERYGFYQDAARAKIIDRKNLLNIEKIPEPPLKKKLDELIAAKDWLSFAWLLHYTKVLAPGFSYQFDKSSAKQGVKELLEERRKVVVETRPHIDLLGDSVFMDCVVGAKLSGIGEDFLTKQDWREIQQDFESIRSHEFYSDPEQNKEVATSKLIGDAAKIKILNAEKVNITNQGLEIIMPHQLAETDTHLIPEKRKF